MPTIATGVAKRVKYKQEVTWGVVPAAASAQALRRVSSTLALKKGTFESAELLAHLQRQDYRHGIRSVAGTLSGEQSPGTYKDFMAAAVRRAFTAVSAITGASITVAGAGPTYTITRAAGSFLTDGIKAGQVVKLTAGSFNAANLNKNLVVMAVTSATVLTVQPLNSVALLAEGPIAAATVSVPGKVTYAPASGHTDLSYSIEHWHSDLVLSEVFSGNKINRWSNSVPPQGMATTGFDFIGKDIVTAGAEYFTAPTAETASGLLAGPNGLLVVQSSQVATLTGIDFALNANMSAEPVVGSSVYADIAEGRILVDGSATGLFDSGTLRDLFLNETEAQIIIVLATSPAAGADFISYTLPRVKFTDASKDDGDKSLIQTLPFTALFNSAGGAGVGSEATSIYIQDSQA